MNLLERYIFRRTFVVSMITLAATTLMVLVTQVLLYVNLLTASGQALLAFFALAATLVLVARATMSDSQAGLYAAGLIMTKAVLFLPQFVVVIAFPSMSKQGANRRMHLYSLGVVLVIGLVTVVGTALFSGLAVVFIGGPEYADLQSRLWVFAVLGTLLAMIQLLIYNIVARQRQRTVLLIWAALVALLVAAPFLDTLDTLLTTVVAIDSALFALLLVRSLAPSYHQPAPPPTKETARAV